MGHSRPLFGLFSPTLQFLKQTNVGNTACTTRYFVLSFQNLVSDNIKWVYYRDHQKVALVYVLTTSSHRYIKTEVENSARPTIILCS